MIYLVVLFLLYLLVPLIPAMILKKIFPKDIATANGIRGKMKIFVTGGIAVYFIILIVTTPIVIKFAKTNSNPEIIPAKDWTVKAKLMFIDEKGDTINNEFAGQSYDLSDLSSLINNYKNVKIDTLKNEINLGNVVLQKIRNSYDTSKSINNITGGPPPAAHNK